MDITESGRSSRPRRPWYWLLAAMEAFANEGGLIPEQVWGAADIPERELHAGRPSGSAMPLVWAHAEYLKLRRSLRDGRLFDLPPQTVRRYLVENAVPARQVWRFNHKIRSVPAGKMLRIEMPAAARIRWSGDDWRSAHGLLSHDPGLGVHIADLPTQALAEGARIRFTFHWLEAGRWEGADFLVLVDRHDEPRQFTSQLHEDAQIPAATMTLHSYRSRDTDDQSSVDGRHQQAVPDRRADPP